MYVKQQMCSKKEGSESTTKMASRLSLVAAFDDLVRNANVLTEGIEPEFIKLAQSLESTRQRWFESEQEVLRQRAELTHVQNENLGLQTKLKHARSQIEHEVERRVRVERERDACEHQIAVIRELLNNKNSKSIINAEDREKLAFLTTDESQYGPSPSRLCPVAESSASLLSDISYDKTEEDLDKSYLHGGRNWKRPSAPLLEEHDRLTAPKRRKSDDKNGEDSFITTTTITVDAKGQPIAACTEVTVPKLNKSFSEPALDKHQQHRRAESDSEDEDVWRTPNRQGSRRGILRRTPDMPFTPILRKANSTGRGLNRVHTFISKTFLKPETCTPCGKRIKFGKMAMKCKECRGACHTDCKDQMPLPCIPSSASTPGHKSMNGVISDFAPLSAPMVPAIIVHCVNEVETRGLSEVGIYRVPGSDKQVKELKEKFLRGKTLPNLSQVDDIHVVCGCLKDFLRSLKEPIITFKLWGNFSKSSEDPNLDRCHAQLYEIVHRLPQANRDTLAFLILHLQRVSECDECKMPAQNLAKVFGPTIVGYSVAEPEPMQMINQTGQQSNVIEKLMSISTTFWMNFLNIEGDYPSSVHNTPRTPDTKPVLQSMLGPVSTPTSMDRNRTMANRTAHTPRFGNKTSHVNKKPSHFFSSPMVV